MRRLVLLVALATAAPTGAGIDFPMRSVVPERGFVTRDYETSTYRSFSRAREILLSALAAHGASDDVPALAVEARGDQWVMGNHSRPWENRVVPAEKRWIFLAEGVASQAEAVFNPVAGRLSARSAVAGGKGIRKTAFDVAPTSVTGTDADALLGSLEESMPHLLLRRARRSMASLRHAGEVREGKRTLDLLTFASAGGQVLTLFVDRETKLVARVEKLVADPYYGDAVLATAFSDYADVLGIRVPLHRVDTRLGRTEIDVRYVVSAPTDADRAAFESAGLSVPPAPQDDPAAAVRVDPVAPGVFALTLTKRGMRAYAVERSRDVAVLETPLDDAAGDALLAAIRKAIPGKPIGLVGFSHEHRHTATGIAPFVREGAAVIATEETARFVEDLLALRHAQSPQWSAPPRRPPAVRLVRERLEIPDPTSPIVVFNAGATNWTDPSHGRDATLPRRDYLLFYLPTQGVFLTGCLSSFRGDDDEPVGSDRQERLLGTIRSLGIEPKLLCNATGAEDVRLATTLDDLAKAVARREAARSLLDTLETCDASCLAARRSELTNECRARGVGIHYLDGAAETILLRDPAIGREWGRLMTELAPASELGWLRLSAAEEGLGNLAAALEAARTARLRKPADPEIEALVTRLESLAVKPSPPPGS